MKKQTFNFSGFLAITLTVFLFSGENAFSQKDSSSDIIKDEGKKPWVIDIEEATVDNSHYRMAVWTGKHMQLVLMSLEPGEEIELELHDGHDQFVRIEKGEARVLMGKEKDNLSYDKKVGDDWIVMIPAGYWHQIINVGDEPLKVYTLYSPPEHEYGTVHEHFEDAEGHHH